MGDVSHDSVNRFLLRERYEPQDLFDMVKSIINLRGGIVSVDDTVVEKLYSNPKFAELIGYFWSGKYHKSIKGLNLITLYYNDIQGNSVPINYRIYDKQEGKTKNDYFREMLIEVIAWGLKPRLVTGDSWYSMKVISRSELITIHDTHWGIEAFHRAIKQVCGICRFMVRNSYAIKTHIFCSLQAFVRLELMRSEKTIANWYEVQRKLFIKVVREYILAD